jgi:formyltetrahydrofolate dehydrogenase
LKELKNRGFEVCAVFTIPDVNSRADALATMAEQEKIPVYKVDKWKALKKDGGKVLPDVFEKYKGVKADLNVLAYVTQFIPMEVITSPKHQSIIYHPSLLPRHRGASAINWTLMQGDKKSGYSVFWADDGLDTGPLLLSREVEVAINDTVNGLYKRFLFPQGVIGIADAVVLIRDGKAPRIPQTSDGASYEELWTDKNKAKIDWNRGGEALHNLIRGSDRVPGAWTTIGGSQVTLYDSNFLGVEPKIDSTVSKAISIDGVTNKAVQTPDGIVFFGFDNVAFLVKTVQIEKTQIPAADWGKEKK